MEGSGERRVESKREGQGWMCGGSKRVGWGQRREGRIGWVQKGRDGGLGCPDSLTLFFKYLHGPILTRGV